MNSDHSRINTELLRNDKNKFLVACQPLIEIIVKKYTFRSTLHHTDYEDITQTINEQLFKRLDIIEKQYNGTVMLTTYISVIIRNICVSILEGFHKESKRENILLYNLITEPDVEYRLFINDEINRLKKLFTLHSSKMPKLIICTKVYFRIPINRFDVDTFLYHIDDSLKSQILQHFGKDYSNTYEAKNFHILSKVICHDLGTLISGDSLRKWTERKIHEIIAILNGNPPRYSYDVKSFAELFEYYCFCRISPHTKDNRDDGK